ncbi:tunicamycin resistance protein [Coemansia nantahalensis]|uniref:Tunicamycin resistance protein n=2 Tax=Coemansia TaxID=4863 RepID=A0ACC1LCF8_9FUNG|nr:tunicamycin resistance protein [Coemansia nantahalensis]KAJ2774541.1 tunicamycin resistance protein [Coemansia nantahalensis]KAJ2805391.1 tunicamycin resistance protein [Coemansia helicoidea]
MMHAKVTAAVSPVVVALLWQLRDEPLAACLCMAALAGLATWCVVPAATATFKRAGLSGADLAKPGRPVLAESMGVAAATIYLAATFLFIPLQFRSQLAAPSRHAFPFERLGQYLSALLSLQSMVFLGFADDVIDLRWRYKLLLPTIASIPVLVVYYVGHGVTHVVLPVFMRGWFATNTVDLGALYYVYMGLMAVFCTNAINILAGINGVEVGQSLVIAVSIIAKDIANINSSNPEAGYCHLFSLYLLLPFVAVSLALYYWNVYPARVFVGDTYCYFAGMTFAVCGILGHFSKTLLLLFVPQIFNFVYSAPQIFGLVPCPRHRLPKMVVESSIPAGLVAKLQRAVDADSAAACDSGFEAAPGSRHPAPATGLDALHRTISTAMLSFSKTERPAGPRPRRPSAHAAAYLVPSRAALAGSRPLGLLIVRLYEQLGIADVERDAHGAMVSVNNLTLLNLVLVQCRRLTEAQLNNRILLIQLANSALAFIIRYQLSNVFY